MGQCEVSTGTGASAAVRPEAHEPSAMIREIVPSDVDFAKGMLNSNRSDAEILASLTLRGLEPARASQLVADLRHGRRVASDLSFLPPPGTHHGGHAKASTAKSKPYWEQSVTPKRAHSGRHRRAATPWWLVFLIVVFVGALVYAWMNLGRQSAGDAATQRRHELPPPPGK